MGMTNGWSVSTNDGSVMKFIDKLVITVTETDMEKVRAKARREMRVKHEKRLPAGPHSGQKGEYNRSKSKRWSDEW
jgi:hypothetical protein